MSQISANLRVFDPIRETKPEAGRSAPVNPQQHTQVSFNDILQFSKHANTRLNDRNIELTGDQMARVEGGINRANEKGIRDSLVLVDNLALVVNIKSRTVITALSRDAQNVFSNIDGAVIV